MLYEPIVLQGDNGTFSYTPDFVIAMTTYGYTTKRTHVIIESKSSQDALYEPDLDKKVKLVTEHHNMHMILMYGQRPCVKYIQKYDTNWQTKCTTFYHYMKR